MERFLKTVVLLFSIFYGSVLCQSDTCAHKADILFVMDASGSVGIKEFQKQLQFAATFINKFQVGLAQFSILRFDNLANVMFKFDDYKDNTALKNAILNIPYTGGGTDTAAALKLARERAFLTTQGSRTGVPKVVIVSTDGLSNSPNDTVIEAQKLKDTKVLVLSIGIGSQVNKQELNTISTFPEDVFEVRDYDQLLSIVNEYGEMVCRVVQLFNCNNKADIFFLLDSSSRISPDAYQKELFFAANFTSQFNLTDNRVGAATFGGNGALKLFNIGLFTNQIQLTQSILSSVYVGGATDINAALQFISNQQVFAPASGGRVDASKILIILTDGGSVSAAQAKTTASLLRATGVNIVAVGVSKPNIPELKDLINHPVYDLITNLEYPNIAVERVQVLTGVHQCDVPVIPARDVSNICRLLNWINGIHPHPFDCTKFIECTFLRTDLMNCTKNMIFDPVALTCNYPAFVPSDTCNAFNSNTTLPPNIGTATPPTPTGKPCVRGSVDILLILDSSDSVGNPGFREELGYAATLAENFNLTDVRFSALSYGSYVKNLFNFNAYNEYRVLQGAILNTAFIGGLANTDLALVSAGTVFDAAHGSRPEALKVAIVLTSGKSTNSQKTIDQATALKKAGIRVISVGFSSPNLKELQDIASTPAEAFVNNFQGVLQAIRQNSNTTCVTEVVKCHGIQFADVIFVLDSSNSITDKDYENLLGFVSDVTTKFTLGPNDVRFGGVVFSQDTVKLFDLKDFTTHDQLKSAIMSAQHLKSGTDTAKALNFIRDQGMFSLSAGARVNATKIVVILTDGRSNSMNETVTASQSLKAIGAKFISIGVGDQIFQEELQQLASDNSSLFLVPDFPALQQITDSVTRRVCDYPKEPENVPDYTYLCKAYGWADGRHPNPRDCSNYVVCSGLTTQVFSCPANQAYDPITQSCRLTSVAHPCNDTSYFGPTVPPRPIIDFTTKGPSMNIKIETLCQDHHLVDGIYPDPGSCNHFVECTAFITQHLECPTGLNFNSKKYVCDDVHVIDCQDNYDYFDTSAPIVG